MISIRVEVAEGQILQLPLELPDTEAVGDRSKDLQRLAGNGLLSFRGQCPERPHVVQAVGQLDDHHADVIHHGEEHLAQVLGLLLVEHPLV